MGKALIGPDGKIRSFKDFKIAAQGVVGTQLRWLETEYNMAIAGAQLAGKWQKIQAEKKTFPLLQFVAVIDNHTTDLCRSLNGIILPVDHPFWLTWYPPNHWGERATVKQLRDGKVTPESDIVYPIIADMFKTNLGEQGLVFPPDHPYYTDVAPHIIDNATLYMPEDEQYLTQYEAPKGNGKVTVNRKTAIANKPDLEKLQQVAKVLADEGKAVEILPEINAAEQALRDELLPGAKERKNPDMRVDGEYTEVKTPDKPLSFNKLQQAASKGVKQADQLIILLEEEYSEEDMKAVADSRFTIYPDLESIGYVTIDGEYIEYFNNKRQKK